MTEHATLAEAIVAALAELTTVAKANSANVGTYSYSYADIADVVNATRPVLAGHGLTVLTSVHGHEGGLLACTVEILHSSGESKEFRPLPFPAGRDAQATGSAITYHRRYALLSALGMATDDDDGATASRAPRQVASTTYSAAAAKKSLLDRLGNIDDATQHAADLWAKHIGESREITQAEWATLAKAATELAADAAADPWAGSS